MPNHVHGILILEGDDGNSVETRNSLSLPQPPKQSLPQPPSPHQTIGQKRFQNQGKKFHLLHGRFI